MRAPRRATSTAAAVLLVVLPATAAPSMGPNALPAASDPGTAAAGPVAPLPVEAAPTAVPPPTTVPVPTGSVATGAPVGGAYAGEVVDGIPAEALRAYRAAAATIAAQDPSCGLDWALLAGIGRVESNHGRYGGSVPDAQGVVRPAILGPVLSGGPGMARISDHDGGSLDGDVVFDRAVGPMQFIPSTWAMSGADGDGDGVANPSDLDDAALAAGRYLCAGGGRLDTVEGARAALLRYNHSDAYGQRVLWLAAAYRSGGSIVTLLNAGPAVTPPPYVPAVGGPRTVPPVDPTPAVESRTINITVVVAAPPASVTPVPTTPRPTTPTTPTTTTPTPTTPLPPTDVRTLPPTGPADSPTSPSPTSPTTTGGTDQPTTSPTTSPTSEPTTSPTSEPTTSPTSEPTTSPTSEPTTSPTTTPTGDRTTEPTTSPTTSPTSDAPTGDRTTEPTSSSTSRPTASPSTSRTPSSTSSPTDCATPTDEADRPRSTDATDPTDPPADEEECANVPKGSTDQSTDSSSDPGRER